MPNNFLLVPGFAGSELGHRGGLPGGDDNVIWFRAAVIAAGTFYWHAALGPDGIHPVTGGGKPLGVTGLLPFYYLPFCDAMRRLGWTPYGFAHDWRWKIDMNGARCAQHIRDLAAKLGEPLKIVCHSRGGLVVAAAAEKLRQTDELKLIDRVIALACPWRGSWAALPWLEDISWEYPGSLALFNMASAAIHVAPVPQKVIDTAKTWPSVYELLIDPNLPNAGGDDSAFALYAPATYAKAGLTLTAQWLTDAAARWTAYTQPLKDVRTHCVVGTGMDTPRGPFIPSHFPGRRALTSDDKGDTTVQVASARLPGVPSTVVEETHCGMLGSNNVRQHVADLLGEE